MTPPSAPDPLDALGSPPGPVPADLRREMLARAAEQGLIDVAYELHDSPVGRLLLAATSAGLVKVAFEGGGEEQVLDELAGRVGVRVVRRAEALDAVRRQLDEFFAGRRLEFELRLDLRLAQGFRRIVLDHLRQVAYGHTASYAALAAAAGRPRAVRAAASACATNPLPLVIPCHRIVRSDGSIGRYGGGAEAKRWLLDLEQGGDPGG